MSASCAIPTSSSRACSSPTTSQENSTCSIPQPPNQSPVPKVKSSSETTVPVVAPGIATTAIFSVVSGILLEPLPYDEPENLVYINTYFLPESGYDFPEYAVGSPEYFDYKNATRSMEEVAAVSTESARRAASGSGLSGP